MGRSLSEAHHGADITGTASMPKPSVSNQTVFLYSSIASELSSHFGESNSPSPNDELRVSLPQAGSESVVNFREPVLRSRVSRMIHSAPQGRLRHCRTAVINCRPCLSGIGPALQSPLADMIRANDGAWPITTLSLLESCTVSCLSS